MVVSLYLSELSERRLSHFNRQEPLDNLSGPATMIDTFPNRSEVDFTQVVGGNASQIQEFLYARHCPRRPKASRVAGAFTD
jgi:hypothetical protein